MNPVVVTPDGGTAVQESGLTLSQIIAPYMNVFFLAFFVAIVMTPVMRILAVRNGVVDWPDLKRKNHIQPVAYLGGIAIFIGWLSGILLCYFTVSHTSRGGSATGVDFPLSIILGAAAIAITGVLDDVYGISPKVKIGGQLFAAAALAQERVGLSLVEQTFDILHISAPEWCIYILGTAIIAFFVVGGCNAVNLLDGLDGLAAGVVTIAMIGFLFIAAMEAARLHDQQSAPQGLIADPIRIVMCLATIGAILGFLPYNFNPASIFMGDAGSLLLGYLSVASILLFAQKGVKDNLLMVTACLIVFALPITDTSLAIFRRKLRGKPIFSPDNQHIHHLLRRSGLSVKQTVMVMYGLAITFAVLGCTLVAMQLRWRYILAVFVVLYGFIMVISYKYSKNTILSESTSPDNNPSVQNKTDKSYEKPAV